MPNDCISYQDSGYFTPIITDYLNQKPVLQPLYNRFPTLENFEDQIEEKRKNFNHDYRQNLVAVLNRQYSGIAVSAATQRNIDLFSNKNTFTVTTGHQLNLFSGPLYFLYKIITAINLSTELKAKYRDCDFVPVYWMATEDHDFEEISYFNFKGKKFRWNKESFGPVGRLDTQGLDEVFDVFASELGTGNTANELKSLFRKSYLEHANLADATRFLANALFSTFGLVILDADDKTLKTEFIPYVKAELLHRNAHQQVTKTIEKLKAYEIQVNPREINLFYLEDNLRERIVFDNGLYKVNNTQLQFDETEILELLADSPEKFSPNVIMRPLYEEVILPNLCYIGGGGEIAYWLELKSFFDLANVTFPILMLRNSALIATQKQAKKADNLELEWKDLFLKQHDLLDKKVRSLSEFPIDLTVQKDLLAEQFSYLHDIAEKTDKSFTGAVKAQAAKQINGLENLEKRLLRAQKRKHKDELERMVNLQDALFPNKGLQERQANFSEFYIENGTGLIEKLFEILKPFGGRFEVAVL